MPLNPNVIDLRAQFNKPTVAFVAKVKVAGTYTPTFARSPVVGETICRESRDCVFILDSGDVVSITVDNNTKTFVGIPDDRQHN